MVLHNGNTYQDDEAIDWHIALDVNNDYFGLARNLGLPLPPACYVFLDDHLKTHNQHMICGRYAALLHSAKLDKILTKKEKFLF